MKKLKTNSSFKRTVYVLALYLVGLFLVSLLTTSGLTLSAERSLLEVFYSVPERYDIIILNITHFGSLATLYSAVFVTLILGFRELSLKLLFGGMSAYLTAALMKELVMRDRPAQLWSEIAAREWGPVSYGYPSGHTALIVALVFILWPYVKPPYRLLLVLLAVSVAASRMVLGVHLPLDIVGGALVGLISGHIARYAVSRFKIKD